MGLPLALYYLWGRGSTERSPLQPHQSEKRPDGQLIWLHAPRPEDQTVVGDLVYRLSDRHPDIWFLITSDAADKANCRDNCIHQPIPPDSRKAVASFLKTWSPDVGGWLGGELRPGLISEAAATGMPLYMFDTGNAHATALFKTRIPGLRKSVLRQFEAILAGDKKTAATFLRAGATAEQVRTAGVLERGVTTLRCLEAERDTLASLFATRPVWLAAESDPGEYDAVLAAHATALRRTHRLLLIVVPSNPADGQALAKMLAERDMSYEMRSEGGEPEAETQVYIADTDNEMGLWYRLAPTSFLGQTLVSGEGPHPFNAAALGSVVLHGPETEHHRDAFLRLGRVGASQQVTNAAELAAGVETLLAPDKAAEMAHAAWLVCSAGAEVADLVLDLLSDALLKRRTDA